MLLPEPLDFIWFVNQLTGLEEVYRRQFRGMFLLQRWPKVLRGIFKFAVYACVPVSKEHTYFKQ